MMDKLEKLPIFNKARAMQKLVEHIIESVENTDIDFEHNIEAEMLKNNLSYMRENSLIIPAKIAGAADDDMLYDIRMENAAIIRKAARELITDARGIEMHGFKDIEYLDLLRQEVDEFRVLFAEWVKTFDCWNYIIDRWGLFNPPGVNYDDKDPDDDIPFNQDDFEGL
ncbi:hypothetical protein H7U19_10330 [Hyunsoonleella sp. SJ7]|uniref:DUF4254 domain-containing protein n=1 Tax=Hyunsoonleella aquatilis TaxID=2762758 RepID=A0A923HCV0_9FLAO|nr:hypothetical protein [Hyunsoonleella aquatilis]MBC3758801.1 hypothetical protein [Hyunsoonleella aquatilis]